MKDRRKKKASMSFGTSLGLSFNNLRTKKGRTILTAFAGSIGIIGIALILSLSAGVGDYIESIEEDTMAEYPIEITTAAFDISSMLSEGAGSIISDMMHEDEEAEITVTSVISTMFSRIGTNDLAALKEYIDSGESGIPEQVMAIEYDYDAEPLIFMQEDGDVRQVNPDNTMSNSGSLLTTMLASQTACFYEMPESDALYMDQYEVKAGHWPENYNECVLVLSSNGSVSDYMLYTLGLRNFSELEDIIDQYNNGEEITVIESDTAYSYDDVLGITYKTVCSADLYTYDEEYDVWVDKSDNAEFMADLVEKGEDLTIVGVVQPVEDATGANLTSGINYPASLVRHLSDLSAESEVLQAQMAQADINIFTGEEFGDEADFDISSMLSIDEDAMSDAFSIADSFSEIEFDTDSIDMDFSDMDFDMSGMDFDLSGMEFDMSDMDLDFSGMNFDMSGMDFDMSDMEFDFSAFQIEMPEMDLSSAVSIDTSVLSSLAAQILSGYSIPDFSDYLTGDEAMSVVTEMLNDFVTVSGDGLEKVISDALEEAEEGKEVDTLMEAITDYISEYATITIDEGDASALEKALVDAYEGSIQKSFNDYLSSDAVQMTLSVGIGTMLDMGGMQDAMSAYMESAISQMTLTMEEQMAAMTAQMSSAMEAAMSDMTTQMTASMETVMSGVTDQMTSLMEGAMSGMTDQIMEQISAGMEDMMSEIMEEMSTQISDQISDSLNLDMDDLEEAFDFNMDATDLTDLLTSMSSGSGTSYASNLAELGYVDYDSPSGINIYPLDFDSREEIVNILDDYNADAEAAGESERVITYTDLVATMMSSVTTIVNSVSYVLIAFIAVSLVVSCIMISIITQISVMERTKEIGILRALGASKRNISAVFNAETFIIGSCSGVIGVLISELLIIPINVIIHMVTGYSNINAVLQWNYALILVLISIVITVISGLIPALRAARRDPVTALRTE